MSEMNKTTNGIKNLNESQFHQSIRQVFNKTMRENFDRFILLRYFKLQVIYSVIVQAKKQQKITNEYHLQNKLVCNSVSSW